MPHAPKIVPTIFCKRLRSDSAHRARLFILVFLLLLIAKLTNFTLKFSPNADHGTPLFSVPSAVAQGTFACATVTEIPQIECRALVALYESTNGSTWAVNSGWLATATPCSWVGITCQANHVIGLQLPGNGLRGTLPVELGALLYLQVLDLAAEAPLVAAQRLEEAPPSAHHSLLTEAKFTSDLLFQTMIDGHQQLVERRTLISATLQFAHTSDVTIATATALTRSVALPADAHDIALSEQRTKISVHLRTQLAGHLPDRSSLAVATVNADPTEFVGSAVDVSSLVAEPVEATNDDTSGIAFNQLTGPLPPSLGNMRELRQLNLIGNQLSGSIPPELGLLQNLTSLMLFDNALTGSIPPALGQLTNLQVLDLGVNGLTGSIPPELGKLTTLTALGLCGNGLTGSIPPELGNLTNVTIFFLCYNGLSGSIPTELGRLSNVQNLRLDVNRLSGPIPASLGNLQNVQFLRLESNELTGSIPAALGELPNCFYLSLAHNGLSGVIPATLANLPSLSNLDLSDNRLSGAMPSTLGDVPSLVELNLALNQLSGAIPSALGNLRNLQFLNLLLNKLSGPLPDELSNLGQLQYLVLSDNQLNGVIPAWVTTLVDLRALHLFNNRLSGALPAGLGNLTKLQQLAFFNNQLTGGLPAEVGTLTELTHLVATPNQLSGPLPPELGQLTSLQLLWLGENHFTGTIPTELGNLTALRQLWLQENRLSGPIPADLGNLSSLQILQINHNQLSGEIPVTLGDLSQLNTLWLHNNHLTGTIPAHLADLPNLEVLALSTNALSGPIPPALGRLTNLRQLWLRENRLGGTLPPELGNLTNLQTLWLDVNQLRGPIPPQWGQLVNLQELTMAVNQLSGPIPPQLANLSALTDLWLRANWLTGEIPPELGVLTKLRTLYLDGNQLRGALPPALGQLTDLTELLLHSNQLTGPIPAQWGMLKNLQTLWLAGNELRGPLPAELGNLRHLIDLNLAYNQFDGAIPPEMRFLNGLVNLNLGYNQLTATESELLLFLAQKAPTWAATQTVAPTAIQALPQRSDAVALTWIPIAYGNDGGAYEVEIASAETGPFTLHGRTVDKRSPGYVAEGLTPNSTYYFRVRTVTPPHGTQQAALLSAYTAVVSATTNATPIVGDSYENDNQCAGARTLVTDGRSTNHTFHQPGDQDWVQIRVQKEVAYRIDVQTPVDSQADVTFKLYDSCVDTEPEIVDQSFSPGLQFAFVAPQDGEIYLQLTNSEEPLGGNDFSYQVTVRAVNGESGSGAVILLAGRLSQADDVQANIEFVTQRLYQILLANGYSADDIYYLSTDEKRAGVDAPATTANLHYAITTWAKDRITDEQGLTLYLMDHGDKGLLYVDHLHDQQLTPAQLDDWLSQLELESPNSPINVLIEACYSGSFITGATGDGQGISKPGRVIITSTNLHDLAYASQEGAYFSDHLLTALRQGHHLFSGFWEARIATRQVTSLYQDPWLDADGDGVPNELEDAAIAARRTLFVPTAQVTSNLWPPYIATLQTAARDDGQPRIEAEVLDNQRVAKVWAVIYPPGYIPPTEGNELAAETLPPVELTLEGNRYVLHYSGFTQPGDYRVVVQAEDSDGLRARPAVITLNPTAAPDRDSVDLHSQRVFLPLVNR